MWTQFDIIVNLIYYGSLFLIVMLWIFLPIDFNCSCDESCPERAMIGDALAVVATTIALFGAAMHGDSFSMAAVFLTYYLTVSIIIMKCVYSNHLSLR